jgi:uncharacterized phiE125 gp8 family phage protein
MSDWLIIGVDRATLPANMLSIAKSHLRVTFDDDDEYIRLCLSRAIDLFERHAGWFVFTRTVEWTPPNGKVLLPTPVQPIDGMTALDSLGSDVTAQYRIYANHETLRWYFERLDKAAIPAGLKVTLIAGFASMANLPPSVTDITLRLTAYFYENRESIASYSLEQVPQWMNDLLLGNWIPRA